MNIQDLKNKYQGKRIFIIGNGPSLNKTPLDLLTNEYTFAFNKIHLLYDKTNWRPSFFANGWSLALESEADDIIKKTISLDIPCFIFQSDRKYFPERENIFFYNDISLSEKFETSKDHLDISKINDYREVWSDDITKAVYRHSTIVYCAMQIAVYMGFKEIYLVACDLFNSSEPYMIFKNALNPADFIIERKRNNTFSKKRFLLDYFRSTNKPLRSIINLAAFYTVRYKFMRNLLMRLPLIRSFLKDSNHFNDNYCIMPWSSKHINNKLNANHKLAKAVSEAYGFHVYNATIGGFLEVYPRVNIYDLLKNNK